jgi:hypothetical protein
MRFALSKKDLKFGEFHLKVYPHHFQKKSSNLKDDFHWVSDIN